MSVYRFWAFTSFKQCPPVLTDKRLLRFGYQRERCPKTGNLHWQGWLALKEPLTRDEVMRLLKRHPQYLEPSRSKDIEEYCSKIETRA